VGDRRAGLQAEDRSDTLRDCQPGSILPSTGCIIQAELGANKAAAMDVVAACSGFLYGLTLGHDGPHRTVKRMLVTGAEILTQYVDYTIAIPAFCLATARARIRRC
jgi:3-oxoacyl-[acyl-carrier-protein] synthase III